MSVRIFFIFTGFGLAVAGGVSIIAFLNLLTIGYTYEQFLLFIIDRIEFYLLLTGLLIMIITILLPYSNEKEK